MKTLAIFAGSKDISDNESVELHEQLVPFFESVKDTVDKIIYGGGDTGVMGIVYSSALEVGIPINGYSLEKYRKNDEGKDIDMEFYKNAEKRLEGFYKNGDLFLALPGGLGTIEEILRINTLIKENNELKKIFIPIFFESFYTLIETLENEDMVSDEDKGNFVKIKKLKKIKI